MGKDHIIDFKIDENTKKETTVITLILKGDYSNNLVGLKDLEDVVNFLHRNIKSIKRNNKITTIYTDIVKTLENYEYANNLFTIQSNIGLDFLNIETDSLGNPKSDISYNTLIDNVLIYTDSRIYGFDKYEDGGMSILNLKPLCKNNKGNMFTQEDIENVIK